MINSLYICIEKFAILFLYSEFRLQEKGSKDTTVQVCLNQWLHYFLYTWNIKTVTFFFFLTSTRIEKKVITCWFFLHFFTFELIWDKLCLLGELLQIMLQSTYIKTLIYLQYHSSVNYASHVKSFFYLFLEK